MTPPIIDDPFLFDLQNKRGMSRAFAAPSGAMGWATAVRGALDGRMAARACLFVASFSRF